MHARGRERTLKFAPRLVWAVETLAAAPEDRILEIGCGHGVGVALICERLGGGRVTAIDRSATMIEAAAKRNREHVASGRAQLVHASLEDLDLGGERFDKVLAVHVNMFWQQPATALALVAPLLEPAGALYLFTQSPRWRSAAEARDFGARWGEEIELHGWSVAALPVREGPPPSAGVVARRARA